MGLEFLLLYSRAITDKPPLLFAVCIIHPELVHAICHKTVLPVMPARLARCPGQSDQGRAGARPDKRALGTGIGASEVEISVD